MASADSIKSLVRWRAGLGIAAVVLPLLLFGLIERQARRLDALAAEGAEVQAVVTAISRDGGTSHYAYRVDGVEHTWSVAQGEAPYPVGRWFTATYSPEDPSFSRPFAEPSLIAAEAARARAHGWKAALGLFWFFGFFAFVAHRDLGRRRRGAPSERDDPVAYRRRLMLFGGFLLPMVLLILGFHAGDALEQGEPLWPVALSGALVLAILGGVVFFVARRGPREAQARAMKLLRWIAPLALGLALLRLVAALMGY